MSGANYTSAVKVFNFIDSHLTAKNWKYEKNIEELKFTYKVGGDDLPMSFILRVDADKELIRLFSQLPFAFPEDKRVEGAVAVCVANQGMVNGRFEYDVTDGTLFHKVAVCFRGIQIETELIDYIMRLGMGMVDKYNDRFFALSKGYINIGEFIKKE